MDLRLDVVLGRVGVVCGRAVKNESAGHTFHGISGTPIDSVEPGGGCLTLC